MKTACAVLCVSVCLYAASAQIYDGLFKKLMRGYVKDVMPGSSVNSSVSVKLNLQLIQIQDLNVPNQVMKTEVWLSMSWLDERLMWDPVDYGGVHKISFPPAKVWIPDIVLYNGAAGVRSQSIQAVLYNDGSVFLIRPATMRSRCQIGYDISVCKLKFGSWCHNGNELDLDFQTGELKADLTDFFPSYDYEIANNTAVRNVVFYDCCPEPYIDLTYTLSVKQIPARRRRRRR